MATTAADDSFFERFIQERLEANRLGWRGKKNH
jgi:hypothetical protein